jgi:hypothetical protein
MSRRPVTSTAEQGEGPTSPEVGKAFAVKLVEGMPRVCKAVIKAKGGYLKNLKY